MRARTIGIKTAAIAVRIVREVLIFGDKIDHVETQPVHAAIGPELAHFLKLGTDRRVFPIQVGLLRSKEVQIVLLAFGVPTPGVAAKFGAPVIRRAVWRAVAPEIKLTIRAVFIQRFTKPGVLS